MIPALVVDEAQVDEAVDLWAQAVESGDQRLTQRRVCRARGR